MKIGLLKCDFVIPEFHCIDGGIPEMFTHLLGQTGIDAELKIYRVWEGELPAVTDECDAWLTSGARASVFEEEDWIRNFQQFIVALHADRRKTVGICFGHQMIAQALGGEVRRSERGWGIGVQEIAITTAEPWMQPPLTGVRMLFTHQDQVEQLPPGARLLGSTDHCPYAMFAMGDHILAMQSHPEYSRRYLRALIESREAIIAPLTFQTGLASLEQPPHRDEPAAWLRHFLLA
ncbi:MAG TPA: GMP synthase [Verrucomicrobiales bacterium]|nr:GMP synthase [Verrucomicrobiales bacterium]